MDHVHLLAVLTVSWLCIFTAKLRKLYQQSGHESTLARRKKRMTLEGAQSVSAWRMQIIEYGSEGSFLLALS